MKVLKFGGTSLANYERFLGAANLIEQAHNDDQAAVVLSAPAKITNFLVASIEKTIKHEDINQDFIDARMIFSNIIDGLKENNSQFDAVKMFALVDETLTSILEILTGVRALKQCPDNINAWIISRGEMLSIALMEQYFLAQGYEVLVIDPVECLLSEGGYLESSVNIEVSTARIEKLAIKKSQVVLMAGFTASNEKGELVVLGRNGSDYSAACLASCLKAKVCEIWTDVDGVYTCDPRLVSDAKLLNHLSYQEAMELSYFGAKVLHPKTIAPIAQFQIPCVIKNTGNPSAPGSLIDNNKGVDDLKIKGITNLDNVAMFNVSGPGMKGMVGMASSIFETISRASISVILITQSSSEYSISFCVPAADRLTALSLLNDRFKLELQNGLLEPIDVIDDLSIISVIGDGMRTLKGVASSFLYALSGANINIVAIAQGSSERSISTVVPKDKAISAVKATHQALFDEQRKINVFIIGTGGVGTELVAQIKRQREYLSQKNVRFRVCALANSKKVIMDAQGIDLDNWEELLEKSEESFSQGKIINFSKQNNIVNQVVVDCTSSDAVAKTYVDFLNAGFHVVTPNKKANTLDQKYYNSLRKAVLKNYRKFMYDTNVGAGLPVIENLQKLLAAGDEVKCFNGILSGSLSYIFGALDDGLTLSQATLLAKEQGFTEPDPRDDLSGMDVARKLLILARETGLNLELSDVEIEPILPAEYFQTKDVAEFLQKLPQLDEDFAKKVAEAHQKGKVLRYVGNIENGKCRVCIAQVDAKDPLYSVKNGENALAFYTHYYQPIPLLLRGYGAGNNVTAAGIFADILRLVNHSNTL